MPIYRTNSNAETGGQTIGILCVDEYLPFIPGDVNNACSFPFPVKYRLVPGMRSIDVLVNNIAPPPGLIEAARELEAEGARGILCNSGYLLPQQQHIAEAVRIPVATSSLLQLPLVAGSLAPEQTIGILTAAAPPLSADWLRAAGIDVCNPLAIYGLQDEPAIRQMWQACQPGDTEEEERTMLDFDTVSADLVRVAHQLQAEHPDTGAIILECSGFGPYASAIQDATGLPVFDTLTLAHFLFDITHPQRYRGYA